jgi:hypothetical protein
MDKGFEFKNYVDSLGDEKREEYINGLTDEITHIKQYRRHLNKSDVGIKENEKQNLALRLSILENQYRALTGKEHTI